MLKKNHLPITHFPGSRLISSRAILAFMSPPLRASNTNCNTKIIIRPIIVLDQSENRICGCGSGENQSENRICGCDQIENQSENTCGCGQRENQSENRICGCGLEAYHSQMFTRKSYKQHLQASHANYRTKRHHET